MFAAEGSSDLCLLLRQHHIALPFWLKDLWGGVGTGLITLRLKGNGGKGPSDVDND